MEARSVSQCGEPTITCKNQHKSTTNNNKTRRGRNKGLTLAEVTIKSGTGGLYTSTPGAGDVGAKSCQCM